MVNWECKVYVLIKDNVNFEEYKVIGEVLVLVILDNDRFLLIGCIGGKVFYWDMDGDVLIELKGYSGLYDVYFVVIFLNGDCLLMGGVDEKVIIWDN